MTHRKKTPQEIRGERARMKGKWFIQNGLAYRIIRVNTDDVAVAMDNSRGYFMYDKYRIKQLFTYKQIVEMGAPLGSPLEDPKSALTEEYADDA